MAYDATANAVYLTGVFRGSAGALNSAGGADAFVARYAADTGAAAWARSAGGTGEDIGRAVAVAPGGAGPAVTGEFEGMANFGGTPLVATDGADPFVWRLNAAGTSLWAKSFAGVGIAAGLGIAVDKSGHVLSAGRFGGLTDFDPGPGTEGEAATGDDLYVSELDAAGNYVRSWRVHGPGPTVARALALSAAGDVYLAGDYDGFGDFDPTAAVLNLAHVSGTDLFLARLRRSAEPLLAAGADGAAQRGAHLRRRYRRRTAAVQTLRLGGGPHPDRAGGHHGRQRAGPDRDARRRRPSPCGFTTGPNCWPAWSRR